jgi:hypothetical protein
MILIPDIAGSLSWNYLSQVYSIRAPSTILYTLVDSLMMMDLYDLAISFC